jgi:hypothetical protein
MEAWQNKAGEKLAQLDSEVTVVESWNANYFDKLRSRDSAVGIATGYGLADRGVGFRVSVGSRIFSTSSRPVFGPTQPPIQWALGAVSLGVKRPGREADHSPPTSAEVMKKRGSINPLPHMPSWCNA